MRTPDQDERAQSGTAHPSLDDGFGGPDQGDGGDLHDGYGTHDFYGDAANADAAGDTGDSSDTSDTSAADNTFDDAGDDHGGFGGTSTATTGDTSATGDGGSGDAAGGFNNGSDVSEAQAENILTDLLDDVFGDDADQVAQDMQDSSGMNANDLLTALGDAYTTDDGSSVVTVDDGSGVFDNPFDTPDGVDVPEADLTTPTDLDMTGDGHVNQADLHEAAHPFDFHVDPG